jgi:hypothetical protein
MAVCGRCQGEVVERFVGTTRVLIHANRKIDHPVTAPRKVSPPSESEQRATWGDR